MCMKKLLCIIIFVVTTSIFAQSKSYFDAPFGIGGGFQPGWIIPKVSTLNEKIKSFGAPELSTSGFLATGGAGFVYIGAIPNLRVGGMGLGGSTKNSALVNGYNEEVEYSSGFGGLTVEYTLPWLRKPAISVGAIIGGGQSSIIVSRHKGDFTWDGVWSDISTPGNSSESFSRTMKNSYFTIVPTLNVDIPLYRFLSFRVGAGYSFALGSNWQLDNNINLNNVPNDTNGGGLFIVTGIFIGFFSY